ncbi:MAG: cellulase family glycosylhydrolase, partial [Acidobacteriota bacterium]|nr:cellulase family glycosylhydrolase [Acidobacteriota bacterium]
MFSPSSAFPGARWKQLNGDNDDGRLWQSEDLQKQAAPFWTDLAWKLRDHPALVGYDLLNEPHPGRTLAGLEEVTSQGCRAWQRSVAGSAPDLNRWNRRLVTAIRSVDNRTPIIVEPAGYAALAAVPLLEPIDDEAVICSFHTYEPWVYTTKRANQGRYEYPSRMPIGWHDGTEAWDRNQITEAFAAVGEWTRSHALPPSRVLL